MGTLVLAMLALTCTQVEELKGVIERSSILSYREKMELTEKAEGYCPPALSPTDTPPWHSRYSSPVQKQP